MMTAENLTFAEKFDLLGCIQCGRCTGGCPVTVRSNLNIRLFIHDSYFQEKLEELSRLAEIWDCTACHTCAVRCPKGLKPLEVLLGLRSMMVEGGRVRPAVRDALESMFREGNPWGKPRATRGDWMKHQEVKVARPGLAVENLIFTCCTICYDPRVQGIARQLSGLLNRLEIDHGFIGEGESCCGSEARCLGEDYLFQEILEENTGFLNQFQAKRLVTLSPHCLATFRDYYPGLKMPVIHYTELLAGMLDKLGPLIGACSERLAYHDPCYLGKQSSIFEPPRDLLRALKGVELVEFNRSRERSLCCEGGGGKMWVETKSTSERLAETRIKDAKELGARVVAVACPFCLLTLDDAVKSLGYEGEMRVAEITELLGRPPGNRTA